MEKVVLAYSGGLDTSCCVRWLRDRYKAEVICFSAFIGEVANQQDLRKRASSAGASKIYILDLRNEFAKDFILPALRAHARYEGRYPLGTALARPLMVKHLVETAHREKATLVAHGCSAKGNDQVRFEVGIRSLDPRLKIVAPLKEWEIRSREEAIEYAKEKGIQIRTTKKKPYSIDKNLWGVSIEAGILENPWQEPPEDAFLLTGNTKRGRGSTTLTIEFKKGIPIKLNGKSLGLVSLIEKVASIGARYGIGRVDMIENRVVGIKSREVYEVPAATLLIQAHEELESLVFDREFLHYKRLLSEKYAELVYYGLWFSPLREALDSFFARHQGRVNGVVKFRLTASQARVIGRKSPESLYSESLATYSEKDRFDRDAAEGFIKLWGLPYEKIVGK